MTFIEFINQKLALETIAAQLFIAISVIYLVFLRKKQYTFFSFIKKHGLLFAWVTALVATLSSLFYSNYVGFAPCDLCWFQRIFMYPLVFILAIAWVKKEFSIIKYGLTLSVIGLSISLYQNAIYYMGVTSSCQILNSSVSCVKRYIFEFGYITIPMMASTAFLLIIIFLIFQKLYLHERNS